MSTAFDQLPDSHRVKYMWMDGELCSPDVGVPIMTPTMHYGIGVFEGIRSYEGAKGPAVFRLDEHLDRLRRSAKMLRMELPYSTEELSKACCDTLAACGLREGYLRPLGFVDDGKRGLSAMNNRIRVAIVVWPWGAYLGEEGLTRGIRATVSSWARMSSKSFFPKGKICGQYVNSVLAKRDAIMAGYDEAIMLDDEGDVCEASGENIFIVRDGVIYTPPKSARILAGITRQSVMTLAKSMGHEVREERIPRDLLYTADEIFLTGTAAEVTPVREVQSQQVGQGERGPITEAVQSAYFESVRGERKGYEQWLTPYEVKA